MKTKKEIKMGGCKKIKMNSTKFKRLVARHAPLVEYRPRLASLDDPYSTPGVEWTLSQDNKTILHGWNAGSKPGAGKFGTVWTYVPWIN